MYFIHGQHDIHSPPSPNFHSPQVRFINDVLTLTNTTLYSDVTKPQFQNSCAIIGPIQKHTNYLGLSLGIPSRMALAFMIQLVLLVGLPLTRCKASNPSPSLPGLEPDEDSSDSSSHDGHSTYTCHGYGQRRTETGGSCDTRSASNQSVSFPQASSSVRWENSGASASNVPHLEVFHEEEAEEASDEAEKKPDVDALQSQLLRYEEKLERRRIQNRLAARRSRQRKKDQGDYLTKKTQKLHTANTDLKYEIEILTAEKEELMRRLDEHLKVCQNAHKLGGDPMLTRTSSMAEAVQCGAGPAAASVAALDAATAAAGNAAVTAANQGQFQANLAPVISGPATVVTSVTPHILTSGASQLPPFHGNSAGPIHMQQLHFIHPTAPVQASHGQQVANMSQQSAQQVQGSYTATLVGSPQDQPVASTSEQSQQPTQTLILSPQSPSMQSNVLPLVLSDFDEDFQFPHGFQDS